jgi:hypothetical protein
VKKVSAGIRATPSGEYGYLLKTKAHKGIVGVADNDKTFKPDLDSSYRYKIGRTLKKAGTIYFRSNSFFVPVRMRIVASYFKSDHTLFFLKNGIHVLSPPLAQHYRNKHHNGKLTHQCKGYPVIVTMGMNLRIKSINSYTKNQIVYLLRKDGYTVNNYTVRSTFNAAGNVCPE